MLVAVQLKSQSRQVAKLCNCSLCMEMSGLEALSLKDDSLPSVKVNATVLFSILNSYVRRSTRDARVIGTLLGEVKDGTIIVST